MYKYFTKNNFLIIVIIGFYFFSNDIKAQINQKQLITDRPDQTESAETILPGYFQIETGVLFNKANFRLMGLDRNIKSSDIALHLLGLVY